MDYLDPPVISLQLGSKLQPGDIKEGDDVYFECRIDANPKFRRLTWLHNVRLLEGEDLAWNLMVIFMLLHIRDGH